MARTHIVYLNRRDVPARKPLQEAINQLGFKVTLDDDYAPFETEGYLPCTFDGEDAGFDLRFENVEEDISPEVKFSIGARDVAMKLRWSGDPREQLAAVAVSAALVERFGAIIHEPDHNRSLSLEVLLAKARELQDLV
jgi:hypothetical protein